MEDFKAIKNGDGVIDFIKMFFGTHEHEVFEPVNAITTIIRVSPNIDRMEEVVNLRFQNLPDDYLESV